MCKTMESLIIVWKDIITHDEEINIQLRTALLSRVQKNIAFNYDLIQLSKLFSQLPDGLAIFVEEAFRARIIMFLNAGRNLQNWPSKHLKEIIKLLESPDLF